MRRSLALMSVLLAVHAAPRAQGSEEVPFITTPDHVTLAMLRLAGVGARDHVIDLGSGDGRIVITAARRFGATGLGVEIVPELVERSRRNAEKAGVAGRVAFREQDLFQTDLSAAHVVTMYLLPEVNLQLRPRLLQLAPGTRIVSHDWDLGDWLPDRTLTVDVPDKAVGREKLSRLHLWVVPAAVEGLWCAAGGTELQVLQRYQVVQMHWRRGADRQLYTGRLDGSRLRLLGPAPHPALSGRVDGDGLVLRPGRPGRQAAAPQRFVRASGAACPA